jgi:hypothetical protein
MMDQNAPSWTVDTPSLGGRFINGSGALRGENVYVCLDVIASEAKQSMKPQRKNGLLFAEPVIGRRFAPTRWLAMTVSKLSWLLENLLVESPSRNPTL